MQNAMLKRRWRAHLSRTLWLALVVLATSGLFLTACQTGGGGGGAPPVVDGDAVCGNSVIEEGEQCEPPNTTTCDQSCQSIEDGNTLIVDPGEIQGAGYFGRGYDVSGKYADAIQAKDFVLDVNALIEVGLVTARKFAHTEFSTITAKTIEEYQTEMALSADLSGSYGAFSGSVSASFSQSAYSSSSHEFVTMTATMWKGSVELPSAIEGVELQDYMDARAQTNINDAEYSPADIFRNYGTHVLTGIITGARMDMNYTADTSTLSSETSFGAEVEAEYSGLKASASYSTDESTVLEQIDTERRTNVYGGLSEYGQFIHNSGQYELWINSIDGNEMFCGFMPNGLKPIWELATAESRQAEIEDAFYEYMEDSQIFSTISFWIAMVYEHPHYAGQTIEFTDPAERRNELGSFDNMISSAQVADGYVLTLYEHDDYEGQLFQFVGETGKTFSYGNDMASSLRISERDSAEYVTIYKAADYSGDSKRFYGLFDDPSSECLRLNVEAMSFNDQVSSVSIPDGWTVTFYEEWKFGGRSTVYTVSTPRMTGFNDIASSIVIERCP